MTTNQIAYYVARENKRHNVASEMLSSRDIDEKTRHNVVSEQLSALNTQSNYAANIYRAQTDYAAKKLASNMSYASSVYSADSSRMAAQYSADSAKASAKYVADSNRWASVYTADSNKSASMYNADRHYQATVDSAQINSSTTLAKSSMELEGAWQRQKYSSDMNYKGVQANANNSWNIAQLNNTTNSLIAASNQVQTNYRQQEQIKADAIQKQWDRDTSVLNTSINAGQRIISSVLGMFSF